VVGTFKPSLCHHWLRVVRVWSSWRRVLKLTLPNFSLSHFTIWFHSLIIFLFPYQSRISLSHFPQFSVGAIATRKEILLSFHSSSHLIVSDFLSLCFQWCVVSGGGCRSWAESTVGYFRDEWKVSLGGFYSDFGLCLLLWFWFALILIYFNCVYCGLFFQWCFDANWYYIYMMFLFWYFDVFIYIEYWIYMSSLNSLVLEN